MAFMHGRVTDFETKKPLVGADVEVWQASTNGLYEQQDPEQVEFNLRGKFKTDAEGGITFIACGRRRIPFQMMVREYP